MKTKIQFKEMDNFFIINSTENENRTLRDIDNTTYLQVNEMSVQDRCFLNAMLLRSCPKKVLELGVSAGGSSVLILNAIKQTDQAELHAIDYLPFWYKSNDKPSGFIVENYPLLKNKYKIYRGVMATKFINDIGGEIDFVLLDTMHCNPGEILDFLMILPFLKEDATVVFHDISLHASIEHGHNGWSLTTCLLMSSIYGDKFIPDYLSGNPLNLSNNLIFPFPSIGAVRLNQYTKKRLFEVFNLLKLRWMYLPPENDKKEIMEHFSRYYDSILIDYLDTVFNFQNFTFEKYKEKEQEIIEDIKNELNSMRSSKSWRITAPLRKIKHIIRKR